MADGSVAAPASSAAASISPDCAVRAFGELIQIDGSDHRWFEERGDACTLLVFIDDATSQTGAASLCREREHGQLSQCGTRLRRRLWVPCGLLLRQAHRLPDQPVERSRVAPA